MTSMRHAPALLAGAIAAVLAQAAPARADAFNFNTTLDNVLSRAMEMMPGTGVKNVRLGLGRHRARGVPALSQSHRRRQ